LFPLGFRYEVVFFKPSEPCGRKHNQRMSQWEYGKDIEYLGYKSTLAGILSFSGSERGTGNGERVPTV
jgi:hypothetical protein